MIMNDERENLQEQAGQLNRHLIQITAILIGIGVVLNIADTPTVRWLVTFAAITALFVSAICPANCRSLSKSR